MKRLIVHGVHTVEAAIRRFPDRVLHVWVDRKRRDDRLTDVEARARRKRIAVERTDDEGLQRLGVDTRHQGIAAEIRAMEIGDESSLRADLQRLDETPLLLLLDGVQDPHNLGACLRSADAAGVHGVIMPRDRSCPINATVYKVASGAGGLVPLYRVSNLARAMRQIRGQGIWVVGATDDAAQILYETQLTFPLALVLGGEGRGLRRLTRENCDALVRIPMHGFVSSLNVSVAAGVCLFEVRRQRGQNAGAAFTWRR